MTTKRMSTFRGKRQQATYEYLLARLEGKGGPVTSEQLAEDTGFYLLWVKMFLEKLVKANMVKSTLNGYELVELTSYQRALPERAREAVDDSQWWLLFNVDASDELINARLKARFGAEPERIINTGGGRLAGPIPAPDRVEYVDDGG